MSIRSEHPANADQIYRALVLLGADPLLDPELWPESPQEENRLRPLRLRLLGALLAKVELEITAATSRNTEEEPDDVADTLMGWMGQTEPAALGMNVLINRLQRTAVQLMGPEEVGDPPAGRAASSAAVVAAAGMLSAHLVFQQGEVERTRRALDRTGASVIAVLEGIHELRVAIGDVEE
ncbi:hypothetical protein [Streptomyces sp. R41]|uniref:Cyclodeaminase/cyclohydrolase domain-containing protein n=1 Tax=Streptomyces sp. R41 TaxID=3238632 RepID=A0AB39R7E4_9ACTN